MAKNLGGIDSPVNESQGGTNATTFNAARTNMGLNALVNEQTAGYTAVTSDRNKLIHYTGAGGVTLAFDPAATLLDGWSTVVRNDAATAITLDPNGGELIDGAASLTLEPTRAINIYCTGTEFLTQGQSSEIDGANQALSNLASVAINTTLVSDTDVTDNLGTQAIRWNTAYLQNLQTGDTAADVLNIGAWDVDGAAISNFITLTAGNTPTCVLASGVTATTQAANDNSTKIATTAYADAAATSGGLNVGYISTNWYPSGSIFGGTGSSQSAKTRPTGTLYFHPILINKTTTFTDIGILLNNTAAGTSVLGLYNDNGNGAPTGSPITNSNSGSITNTANTFSSYTFGTPITLAAGLYWTAHSTSASSTFVGPPNTTDMGGRGLGIKGIPSNASVIAPQAGWSQPFTYNATLPAVGTLTAQVCFSPVDVYVYLKAQ